MRTVRAHIIILVTIAAAAAGLRAQEPTGKPRSDSSTARTGSTASEEFDIHIDERRINLGSLHAGTEVSIGEGSALVVSVGVAVMARQVDLLLRGVNGHVRFRASLAPVLERIERFRATAGARR